MSNRPDGVLYVGVTNDLIRRSYEATKLRTPSWLVAGLTKQHGLKRLVFFEAYDGIRTAIQREKTIKH